MPSGRAKSEDSRTPETIVGIDNPDGVAKFLATKGTTLLIKGYAGAGKTTLALQMLARLSKGGRGVYFSSRVSENKLVHQLPWVDHIRGRARGQNEIIDTRMGTAEVLAAELFDVISGKSGIKGVKAIVLDTWDGLAKEMGEADRLKSEKTLIAMADSSNSRIIFVSEEPGRTTMDYLVDGIIELVRNEEHNRVFREVEIQKLRGTLVSQHKYLYTLLGGKFRHFDPYKPPGSFEGTRFRPIAESAAAFSYGTREMDRIFGGLGKGNTSVFEYDENVPYPALRLIEIPAIVNALSKGHGVFSIPLPGSGVERLAERIIVLTSEAAVKERCVIATMEDPERTKPPFYGIGMNDADKTGEIITGLIELVRKRSRTEGVLVVESVGQVEGAYASDTNKVLERLSARISSIQRRSIDSMMLFMPSDSTVRARVISMCREYVRLFVKDRSVILMGEKPSTEAMVLEHSRDNPVLPVLTRIV